MIKRENLENRIYTKIKKMESVILMIVAMTFMVLIISYVSEDFTKNVIRLASVTISFALMMISYSSTDISNEKHFNYLIISFFIMSAFKMILFLPINRYSFYNDNLIGFIYVFTRILDASTMAFNIYFIKNSGQSKLHYKYFYLISSIFIISLIVNYPIKDVGIAIRVGTVISIVLLASSLWKNRAIPLIKDYKLNYASAYAIYLLISRVINLIEMEIYGQCDSSLIHEDINLIVFMFFMGCVLKKILSTPYNSLFKDINLKNLKIRELNGRIVKKTEELEKYQNNIHQKDDMFQNLFRGIPVPMLLINNSNQRIAFANSKFLEMFNISDFRQVINKKLSNFIELEGGIYVGYIPKIGERVCVELQRLKVIEEDDQCIVIITDITHKVNSDKIKTELEMKKVEESLRRDFLSTISHDLKVPINVIYSAMQLEDILVANGNCEQVKKYTDSCKQNCISLIELTNNLIDSSRLSFDYLKPSNERFNIVEVVEDNVLRLVNYSEIKEINLVFDTNEEEIYMCADRGFIDRIVTNLISNAIKYTPNGGAISVYINDHNETFDIIIKDNGIGMDEKFIKKAFNLYEVGANQKYASKKGTGIGLFVVKKLVELLKGRVEIQSQVGTGTTITLSFNKENTLDGNWNKDK